MRGTHNGAVLMFIKINVYGTVVKRQIYRTVYQHFLRRLHKCSTLSFVFRVTHAYVWISIEQNNMFVRYLYVISKKQYLIKIDPKRKYNDVLIFFLKCHWSWILWNPLSTQLNRSWRACVFISMSFLFISFFVIAVISVIPCRTR